MSVVQRKWAQFTAHFRDSIHKERPDKVALGSAIGISVNFVPTLGLGFLLAFVLATVLRVSRTSAMATSLITGPLVPIMYGLNLLVGGMIFAPVNGHAGLLDFIANQYTTILRLGNLQAKFLSVLDVVGTTFLVGAAVNAAVFGCCAFFVVRRMLLSRRLS